MGERGGGWGVRRCGLLQYVCVWAACSLRAGKHDDAKVEFAQGPAEYYYRLSLCSAFCGQSGSLGVWALSAGNEKISSAAYPPVRYDTHIHTHRYCNVL